MNEASDSRPSTDEHLRRVRSRARNILYLVADRIARGEDPRDETTDEPWGYHVGATLAEIVVNELENIADARRALDTHR